MNPVDSLGVVFPASGPNRMDTLSPMLADLPGLPEYRVAEHAADLRAMADRFHELIDALPNLVWTCQADGSCDFLSPQWLGYTGIAAEAQLGVGWLQSVHAEDRETLRRRWAESVAAEGRFNVEFRLRRRDGIYRWFDAQVAPLRGANGRIVRWFGSGTDVTARRAEFELADRLAAIVDSSDDAIIGKTLEGTITSWNLGAQRAFGFSASEMIGRAVGELIPLDRANEETSIIERIRRGVSVPPFETVRRRKDGHLIDVSVTISPIRDAAGRIVGASKTVRDISERKAAESERKRMEQKLVETARLESLGVLAGGIAHDFNNLLTGILGNATLAAAEVGAGSSAAACLHDIQQAARRAADLCRQMLAYSGRGHFVIQRVDLNDLVKETAQLLRLSAAKSCALNFDLAARLPAVVADVTQIRQVAMNLVINASEAIGSGGGTITLRTGVAGLTVDQLAEMPNAGDAAPGEYAFLEVADNGCGMAPGTLRRIFDPFFTTKFTGRGLGLAAVQGIVRGHKGVISVRSELGRGTTFRLLLPAAESLPPSAPALTLKDEAPWRGSGTVLIVDDEESVRVVAGRLLERMGFSVVVAEDGEAGLALFRSQPDRFAFVLLDLTMPRMDGDETFRQIRQLNPMARVILASGFSEQDVVARFAGAGLAGFVSKPFDLEALTTAIRSIV